MTDVPKPELQRLQTLLETVRLLNSTLELKELTRIILEVVRAEISVERVSIFLVDRPGNAVRPLVAQEIEAEEISLSIGMGVAGAVAATGEVLDIADAYADPRFTPKFDRKSGFYTNDLFALPVSNRNGEIVGVLELLNRLRPITSADREFLLGISVYIGLALENSLLHADVLERKQRESSRKPDSSQPRHVPQNAYDPLTFAMGYLELAPEQGDLPPAAWKQLEDVRRGLSHAAAAALKFREVLEQQREGLAAMDLGDALRQLSESQAEQWDRQNIKATLIAETAPPVYACEDEMRLVLSFLIRTAEAAVLRSDSNRQLRIHSWCTGRNVHVSIHHDGPAAESVGSRGFAIANLIVQQYKGHIRCESSPDKGTALLIVLPVLHRESLQD